MSLRRASRPNVHMNVEEEPGKLRLQTPLAMVPPIVPLASAVLEGLEVCLDQPIWQASHAGANSQPAQVTELMSLCAQLSLLWQREALVRSDRSVSPRHFNEAEITPFIMEALDEHCQRFRGGGVDMADVLGRNSLFRFFPTVAGRISQGAVPTRDNTIAPLHEYFSHVRVLHQITAICRQLQVDCQLTNHKYIAHQVALLYQSINLSKLPFDHFKARIESRFETIKAVTEQSQHPLLPETHKQWLLQVVGEILEMCHSIPPSLTQRVQPWLDIACNPDFYHL